jgi:hypothetical protein
MATCTITVALCETPHSIAHRGYLKSLDRPNKKVMPNNRLAVWEVAQKIRQAMILLKDHL